MSGDSFRYGSHRIYYLLLGKISDILFFDKVSVVMKILIFWIVLVILLIFDDELPKWMLGAGAGFLILTSMQWCIESALEEVVNRLDRICDKLSRISKDADEEDNYDY